MLGKAPKNIERTDAQAAQDKNKDPHGQFQPVTHEEAAGIVLASAPHERAIIAKEHLEKLRAMRDELDLEMAQSNLAATGHLVKEMYPAAESLVIGYSDGEAKWVVAEITNDGYAHPNPADENGLGDPGSIDWDKVDESLDPSINFDPLVALHLRIDQLVAWEPGQTMIPKGW